MHIQICMSTNFYGQKDVYNMVYNYKKRKESHYEADKAFLARWSVRIMAKRRHCE